MFVLLLIPFNVFALADNAKSSILMEYNTKSVLYENNADEKRAPASMTKMMSLILIFEALDDNRISLDDNVLVSKNASSMGGSQIYLETGSVIRLEELIKSVAVASANDAITALAEHTFGSIDKFVEEMNKKAKELGLKNTVFKNVHGLDAEGHYSTSRDMALIACELIKHEDIFKYSSIYEDYIKHPNGKEIWIVNTNKLINYYKGLDGLKTGYTDNGGYSLTATAKRGNMRLISVVMGEEDNNIRNDDTVELLNYGFSNYKINSLFKTGDIVGNSKVFFGKVDKIDLVVNEDIYQVSSVLDNREYDYKLEVGMLKAPLLKTDKVGNLSVSSNGVLINKYPVYVKFDILKSSFFDYFITNIKRLLGGY